MNHLHRDLEKCLLRCTEKIMPPSRSRERVRVLACTKQTGALAHLSLMLLSCKGELHSYKMFREVLGILPR